jgi:hypothetical protein
MIRQPTAASDEAPADDRSMRVVEYALAGLAIVVAAILALLR